jgi:hypothetical protein
MEFRIDGKPVKSFDVTAPARLQPMPRQRLFSISLLAALPYVYETRTHLTPGEHDLSVAFVNDFKDPSASNLNLRDRNLYVDYVEVADLSAAALQPEMPAMVKAMFESAGGETGDAAKQIVGGFARRAWRRPIKDDELTRLMALYDLAKQSGESFAGSVKLAVKAVLV